MTIINKFAKYSLTNNLIQKYSTHFNTINNVTNDSLREKKYHNGLKTEIIKKRKPTQDDINGYEKPPVSVSDDLIWFIFIIQKGYTEYANLKKKYSIGRDYRYNLIKVLEKEKTLLKANKIKVNEVINDLGNMANISIETLKAVSLCLNINICLKNKLICQICKNNDNDEFYIIENNKLVIIPMSSDNISNNYYIVNNLIKPFKSVSAYKLQELYDICERLDLLTLEDKTSTKKLKKNELYMKINEYVS